MNPTKPVNAQGIHIIGQTPLVDIDKWCVIHSYTRTFIVKLPNGVEDAFKALEENDPLTCEDSMRYDTPLHPVPSQQGMRFSISNIVSPIDAMIGEVKLRTVITGVYPIESDADKRNYKAFIEGVLRARKEGEIAAQAEAMSRGG